MGGILEGTDFCTIWGKVHLWGIVSLQKSYRSTSFTFMSMYIFVMIFSLRKSKENGHSDRSIMEILSPQKGM